MDPITVMVLAVGAGVSIGKAIRKGLDAYSGKSASKKPHTDDEGWKHTETKRFNLLTDTSSNDGSHFTFNPSKPELHATFPRIGQRVGIDSGLGAIVEWDTLNKHDGLSRMAKLESARAGLPSFPEVPQEEPLEMLNPRPNRAFDTSNIEMNREIEKIRKKVSTPAYPLPKPTPDYKSALDRIDFSGIDLSSVGSGFSYRKSSEEIVKEIMEEANAMKYSVDERHLAERMGVPVEELTSVRRRLSLEGISSNNQGMTPVNFPSMALKPTHEEEPHYEGLVRQAAELDAKFPLYGYSPTGKVDIELPAVLPLCNKHDLMKEGCIAPLREVSLLPPLSF